MKYFLFVAVLLSISVCHAGNEAAEIKCLSGLNGVTVAAVFWNSELSEGNRLSMQNELQSRIEYDLRIANIKVAAFGDSSHQITNSGTLMVSMTIENTGCEDCVWIFHMSLNREVRIINSKYFPLYSDVWSKTTFNVISKADVGTTYKSIADEQIKKFINIYLAAHQ